MAPNPYTEGRAQLRRYRYFQPLLRSGARLMHDGPSNSTRVWLLFIILANLGSKVLPAYRQTWHGCSVGQRCAVLLSLLLW